MGNALRFRAFPNRNAGCLPANGVWFSLHTFVVSVLNLLGKGRFRKLAMHVLAFSWVGYATESVSERCPDKAKRH